MALSRIFTRDDPFFGPAPQAFDEFFGPLVHPPHPGHLLAHRPGSGVGLPPMQLDVKETDSEYKIHADLPGVNKEDIDINFDQGVLKISAERKVEKKEDKDTWHVSERRYGMVSRSIRLPSDVEPERINASYEAGVLDITVPKLQKSASGRTSIKVQ